MCNAQFNSVALVLSSTITDVLNRIGVPKGLKGYRFTVYAIEMCVEHTELAANITTKLYPVIAKEFQTNIKAVERALRYTIDQTFLYGDIEELYAVFTNLVDADKGKVTNGNFIKRLVEYITSM